MRAHDESPLWSAWSSVLSCVIKGQSWTRGRASSPGADAMVFHEWRVVDGDGHIVEDQQAIVEFLDPPYTGLDTVFSLFPSLDGRVRGRTGLKPTTLQI